MGAWLPADSESGPEPVEAPSLGSLMGQGARQASTGYVTSMSILERAAGQELLRQVALTHFEIVEITEGDLAPGGSVDIVLRIDEDDVETSAFGLIFAVSLLSFHDARPAGASELHFEADDEWTVGDMVLHLRFECGQLHFYADYIRGRLLKTRVDVAPNGRITIQTVNRGGSARRWLDMLRGKGIRGPVSLVEEESSRFTSKDGEPLRNLEDWRALHPALHWKPGRSAVRLAETWSGADGFPQEVQAALDRSARLRGLTFRKGVVEHETPMPGKGKASVTDLMVWAEDDLGNPVIIGVEGKVDEGFGLLVKDWLPAGKGKGSAENRALRLRHICTGLELDYREEAVQVLVYQLLHRAYAAVLTAQDERAKRAVLLVHSFAEGIQVPRSGWDEFEAFSGALKPGKPVPELGVPWEAGVRDGVELWLLWVIHEQGPREAS